MDNCRVRREEARNREKIFSHLQKSGVVESGCQLAIGVLEKLRTSREIFKSLTICCSKVSIAV